MDFTTTPHSSFEIGQAREYYEERTSNFSYRDNPWGSSFAADVMLEGALRGISGSFVDGRVSGLSFSLEGGDTFNSIPVDLPPEQFYYELRVYHPDMTIHANEYDEAICSIDEPTNPLVTRIIFNKDEPAAVSWAVRKDDDNDK